MPEYIYFSFFEKTTHLNEKLYLGFKPHFSYGIHPEIYSQLFTNTLYVSIPIVTLFYLICK
jgi:hypothetical protein